MKSLYPLIAILMVAAQLLTACSPAAAPAPAATAVPAAQPIKITMWFDPGGDATQAKCLMDNVVAGFNKKDPNIQMEASLQANAWDATRTAVTGGGGPDIVYTPGPSFAFQMAKAGQLLALDSYAQELNWDKQFLPWALSLGKIDGKLYSVPNEIETLILYYNKTLFEQKGWQPPTTIDEYLRLNDVIKQAGLIPNAMGNKSWKPTDEHHVTLFLNHMAGVQKVYDALKGKAKWTDPEFVAALEAMDKLLMEGYFMGGLERYYTTTEDEFQTALGQGKAAMMPTGTWKIGTMNKYFGAEANNPMNGIGCPSPPPMASPCLPWALARPTASTGPPSTRKRLPNS